MRGHDSLPSPYSGMHPDLTTNDDLRSGLVQSTAMQPDVHTVRGEISGSSYGDAAVVTVGPGRQPRSELFYLTIKRTIDVIGALLLLITLFPIFIIVAVAIILEDRSPILYSQERVGKNNRTFRFYKFRSMIRNAAALKPQLDAANEATGPIFKMRRDPRVTRVGRVIRKYSIDELPQLFNVLRGDMSLVGPRPHLPSEVATYTELQKTRLTVQPGLVCLREVSGRSELTFERWIETDLQYIASRSLATDLKILIRLVPAVIGGRGAY